MLAVLDVVGLSPDLLGPHTPHFNKLAAEGFQASLGGILPAVTCSVQSTFLTGLLPREHGIVGNGWYFRDRAEVLLWRQANQLVSGEKLWETARRTKPGLTVAKLFWWYNMYASVDWAVTPRPSYCADGRKYPGIYTQPGALRNELEASLGAFPLFQFWGPGAGLASSDWIARCARQVFDQHRPDLLLCYLPHLDYDLQRYGPEDPRIPAQVAAIDRVAGALIEHLRSQGAQVVVLSEYGIDAVSEPVYANRMLREAGLLEVCWTPHVGELLDPGMSRAFAVCDHQIAHIYASSEDHAAEAAAIFAADPRIERVLDAEGKREFGLDHARAGERVLVAAPGSWFAYPYWLDPARQPDFAHLVEIHKKPGYDPCELFLDPQRWFPRGRIAWQLAKKLLGFRYMMDVIPTDARLVRGSHGRLPDSPARGPLLLCSDPTLRREKIEACEVRDLLLELLLR